MSEFIDDKNSQVDELMIANMLNTLNNPNIVQMLNDDELMLILQTVKNHVVGNARLVQYMEKYGKSR